MKIKNKELEKIRKEFKKAVEEALDGLAKEVFNRAKKQVPNSMICPVCRGAGYFIVDPITRDVEECSNCDGSGHIYRKKIEEV